MADERASAGLYNDDNFINEAPRKYGSIWIRVSEQVRNIIHEERIPAHSPGTAPPINRFSNRFFVSTFGGLLKNAIPYL